MTGVDEVGSMDVVGFDASLSTSSGESELLTSSSGSLFCESVSDISVAVDNTIR